MISHHMRKDRQGKGSNSDTETSGGGASGERFQLSVEEWVHEEVGMRGANMISAKETVNKTK